MNKVIDDYGNYIKCYRKACKQEVRKQEKLLKAMRATSPEMPEEQSNAAFKQWLVRVKKHNEEMYAQAEYIAAIACKFDKCHHGALKEMQMLKSSLDGSCIRDKRKCDIAKKITQLLKDPSKITSKDFVWAETHAY